jgi:hypothetical protein
MLTANSFMKREFGKKLIDDFLPRIDLTHIVDTSKMGHTLTGHGTPTVMLFGRQRKPTQSSVRAVLGIKGEPSESKEGEPGMVWNSIVRNIDVPYSQDEFTSTSDIPRSTLAKHPWAIVGGGAGDVQEAIEAAGVSSLSEIAVVIGRVAHTGSDEAYLDANGSLLRHSIEPQYIAVFVEGDRVRDWSLLEPVQILFPYDESLRPLRDNTSAAVFAWLWPFRDQLWKRREPNGTHREIGKTWYEFSRFHPERFFGKGISMPEVATLNHFVLDEGRKVFKNSAPVIKLKPEATDETYFGLLGLLNSSIAGFWMKQTCHDKGGGGIGGGLATELWEHFYSFNGTRVGQFPVCEGKPVFLAKELHSIAQSHSAMLRLVFARTSVPSHVTLTTSKTQAEIGRARMIALQEELDWHCYQLYGLIPDDLRYDGNDLPGLVLGQRAFEIVMARRMATGELNTTWFERHGSTPITEIPAHWPFAFRTLVERRIKLIETNKDIALIEKPEYKRRWNMEPWHDQEHRALKNWLLDRLESEKCRKGTKEHPELTTTAQMADSARADPEFRDVAELYRGRADFDVAALVAELVEGEAVPFLPILRYKPAGLRKREVWERTWDLQRQADAGKDVGEIPIPPKYATTDFLKTDFWRLRGKLDVPKERWITYPHCSTESDRTLVVGWAGWNHIEQATALIAYYDGRKREGWDAKRLIPLLAGLDQLLPWIHQWHPEIEPEFGETAGQSFQTMLEHDAHELGLTLEDIRNWTPPEKARKTRTPSKKKSAAGDRDDA